MITNGIILEFFSFVGLEEMYVIISATLQYHSFFTRSLLESTISPFSIMFLQIMIVFEC